MTVLLDFAYDMRCCFFVLFPFYLFLHYIAMFVDNVSDLVFFCRIIVFSESLTAS